MSVRYAMVSVGRSMRHGLFPSSMVRHCAAHLPPNLTISRPHHLTSSLELRKPAMEDVGDPIRSEELEALFAPFALWPSCALAVSGGSDSSALMVLFADWLRLRGQDGASHVVVTVDHGLRAHSEEEARSVARAALGLGLPHATLVWQGPKPRSGIQAAARRVRYRLIGDYLRSRSIALVLTAHTRDDQAETLLMRLARGSGLDGLSAMSPLSPLAGPEAEAAGALWIGRPLLDIPKARLRATLKARGIAWIEDPSNAEPEFERTRLRAARAQLDALGLTPAMLALSAARLARVRRAVDGIVDAQSSEGDAARLAVVEQAPVAGIARNVVLEAAVADGQLAPAAAAADETCDERIAMFGRAVMPARGNVLAHHLADRLRALPIHVALVGAGTKRQPVPARLAATPRPDARTIVVRRDAVLP